MIVYGQYSPLNEEEVNIINNFAEKYDCMISVDLLSNLHCNYSLPTFALSRMLNKQEVEEICPDIVITMNANTVSEVKSRVAPFKKRFEH